MVYKPTNIPGGVPHCVRNWLKYVNMVFNKYHPLPVGIRSLLHPSIHQPTNGNLGHLWANQTWWKLGNYGKYDEIWHYSYYSFHGSFKHFKTNWLNWGAPPPCSSKQPTTPALPWPPCRALDDGRRKKDMTLDQLPERSSCAEAMSVTRLPGWWLYTHPSEKYEFVHWDD